MIDWFNPIPNISKISFIKFDIGNLYPSISEELLKDALVWAGSLTDITKHEISTIMHCMQKELPIPQWRGLGEEGE